MEGSVVVVVVVVVKGNIVVAVSVVSVVVGGGAVSWMSGGQIYSYLWNVISAMCIQRDSSAK